MNQRETFAHFEICQDDGGGPIEVPSHPGEVACMAWDREHRVLVALHLIPASAGWPVRQREAFAERATLAREVHMPAVAQVLSLGVHEGLCWYACALEPGEPADAWLGRLGPAPDVLALHLALRLSENLTALQRFGRVFRSVTLANTFLTDQPGRSVLLHVRDLGLAETERRNGVDEADLRLAGETLDLFASLLTGGTLELSRVNILRQNPRLLDAVRVARGLASGSPWSLEQVREALRAAFQTAAGTADDSLDVPVEPSRRPRPVLQRALLGQREPAGLLPPQFELKASDFPRAELLTRHATDTVRGNPVLLHLLPPERVISRAVFQPVPAAVRTKRKFSHLLLPASVWESEQMCFVVEDSPSSCSLAQILERRRALGADEGGQILAAVCLALRQAEAAGMMPPALHPGEILITSPGASEEQLSMLQDLPLSHWPAFSVKLRVASSARSLCTPWLMLESVLRHPQEQRIAAGFAALADAISGGVERADRTGLSGPALAALVNVRRQLARGQAVPPPEELLRQLAPAAADALAALSADAALPLPSTGPVPSLQPAAESAVSDAPTTSPAQNLPAVPPASAALPAHAGQNEGSPPPPAESFTEVHLEKILGDGLPESQGSNAAGAAEEETGAASTPLPVRVPRTVAALSQFGIEGAESKGSAPTLDEDVARDSGPEAEPETPAETAEQAPAARQLAADPPLLRLVKPGTQPVPPLETDLPTLSMDLEMLASQDLLRRHVKPSPYTGKRP